MNGSPGTQRGSGMWVVVAVAIIAIAGWYLVHRFSGFGAQPMPLVDGYYLTYAVELNARGLHIDDRYGFKFEQSGNGWQVRGDKGRYNTGLGSGANHRFAIDARGRITQIDGDFTQSFLGKSYSDVWLPAAKRAKGASFKPLFFSGDYTLREQTTWRKWKVWPATSIGFDSEETLYYEADTGWLVGKELTSRDGSTRSDVLADSNISGLVH